MKMNLGLESLQTDMGAQPTMSFEELIDFSVSMGDYSEEIRNDMLIIDQQLVAIENLTSILDSFKKHGSTPVLEDLVGNQIELSEASLEGMIGRAVNSVIDFIKKLLKKIKEFFTGPSNVDNIAKEAEQHLKSIDPNAIIGIKVFQCFLKGIDKITGCVDTSSVLKHQKEYIDWINKDIERINSALKFRQGDLDDNAMNISDDGGVFKNDIFLTPANVKVNDCFLIIKAVRIMLAGRKPTINSLEKIIEELTVLHEHNFSRDGTDKFKYALISCRRVLKVMHIATTNGAKSLLSIRAAKQELASKAQKD